MNYKDLYPRIEGSVCLLHGKAKPTSVLSSITRESKYFRISKGKTFSNPFCVFVFILLSVSLSI